MRLDLKLAQKLVMTPQLQQAIKLLQLSRLEMSQLVYQEMMENPILEDASLDAEADDGEAQVKEDPEAADRDEVVQTIDVFDMRWDNYIEDDELGSGGENIAYYSEADDEKPSYEQTLSSQLSLSDHLNWQLRLITTTDVEKTLGEVIIGNIDEDGYLRDMTLEEIAAMAGTDAARAEKTLRLVQDLDPPGVAARDLRECLLIQARQLGLGGTIVEEILTGHMEELEKKRYQSIARALKVNVKDVQLAAKVIESFEPKPGRPFSVSEVQYIVPDVFIVKKDKDYVILLNDDGMPKLRISPFYKNLMRRGGDEATRDYIESKLRSAQWLIKSIEQRNKTIYRVAESIVTRQKEFLDRGVDSIRPMILKDVAEDIGMHESTISRVTTNKYMHTPQGTYELKYFFSGGISSINGDSLSSITVRNLIHKTISDEDPKNPLNDRLIVNILKSRNIDIARRTVAKYRGELKIPPASVRKKPY
ncbi:MAG TPA: RNA polymerase factor sigma-54 [Nitrospirota bacterium]|nr:RNA polymerase factor sigma-54 [Nitrospirota bacterium]